MKSAPAATRHGVLPDSETVLKSCGDDRLVLSYQNCAAPATGSSQTRYALLPPVAYLTAVAMRQELPLAMLAALRYVALFIYQICAAPFDGFCQTRSGCPSASKSAAPMMRQELPEEMDAELVIVAPLVPPMYQI